MVNKANLTRAAENDILMGRAVPYVSRMKYWSNPSVKKSVCLFCSLGCGVAFRCDGDQAKELDYDKENPVCNGALCPRGHYNIELLNHPGRLMTPMIGKRAVAWDEALSFILQELKQFKPEELGIVLSSNASNEDAYMAAKLARSLGTKNISAAGDPADLEAWLGSKYEVPGAQLSSIEEIDNSEALLIVGDILVRSPVLSQRINKVKYGKRGNKVIVIDPNKTHTAWFATTHLKNRPGTEALVLAAMVLGKEADLARISELTGLPAQAIEKAASDFSSAPTGTLIFSPGANKERNDLIGYFAKILAARSGGKKQITFYSFGNTLGVNSILDREVEGHAAYPELIKKIESAEIKSMIMLGEIILGNKIRHLKFTAKSRFFADESPYETEVQLPLASQIDGGGTYILADGRQAAPVPVTPQAGAKTNAEIVSLIMNTEFDRDKLQAEAAASLAKGPVQAKIDQREAVKEVMAIKAGPDRPAENITHFGNNDLVKRFFWYRLKAGELS
ncbi:MAG: molybdopterin-dependent oxidoreductase [Candidatus Margulisbacteria bacterium]|nr:molybdopterin-dependent oxidoreductase [Candidatus Margulisiibacteriota bacterium]